MDFLELTTNHKPPPNRVGKCDGPHEVHLKECAVMLALAEWLFSKGARMVSMHPDGMHLAGFNLNDHLVARGFVHVSLEGRTSVGGRWTRGDDCLRVYPRPGLGDVTSEIGGRHFEFEAKGGCINSTHAGQLSKLRKGLSEAVGQLMAGQTTAQQLIAAVPLHKETERLGQRLAHRCAIAGIQIALVDAEGELHFVDTSPYALPSDT